MNKCIFFLPNKLFCCRPTMLNGQQLRMTSTGDFPSFSPIIRKPGKDTIISIPPLSIFFLVMPNIKARTCTSIPLITIAPGMENLTNNIKFISSDSERTISLEKSLEESVEKSGNEKRSIVSLRKRQINDPPLSRLDEITEKYRSLTRSLLARFPRRSRENQRRRDELNKQDDLPVKYITFNDNSWLNKLKETISSIKLLENKKEDASQTSEENRAKIEKYAPLKSAITGTGHILKEDDDRINLRSKRSSTVNPEMYTTETTKEQKPTTGTIEISNLPDNVINTLKQVQVTFTNMNDPKILGEINENSEPKRISVRHIVENKPFEKYLDQSNTNGEEMSQAISKIEIKEDENTKNIETVLTALTESQTPNDGTILEQDSSAEENKMNSRTSGVHNMEDKTKTMDHIQKVTQEMTNDGSIPEVMMGTPKEKVINNIMMDIIKQENNEEVPIITGVVNDENTENMKTQKTRSLPVSTNSNIEKVIIPIEEQGMIVLVEENLSNASLIELKQLLNSKEQSEGLTLDSTSNPYELEEEISATSKDEIKAKVPRQITEADTVMFDDSLKSDKTVESLPGYTTEEDVTIRKVVPIVNSTLTTETPKENQNSIGLKIPLLSKDIKITTDNLLEAGKERIEAIKEKLKETQQKLISIPDAATLNENLRNTIKKREEELRELFKKFDKRETNFSPYEGARGIQFVTSVPVNSEMLSGHQLDPIKNRPRRLSQPAKIHKPEYYEGNLRSYQKPSNQYVNPQHTPHKHYTEPQNMECDRCALTKPENQYLFPLDSKTQGIVYNNKIYPAKLFGMVDVSAQSEPANDVKYNENTGNYKTRTEVQYVEKLPVGSDTDRYSADFVDDYVDPEAEYPTEYISADQTKKMTSNSPQKEVNEQQQPYIPVVILTQRDKQYLPRTKSERQRRSIELNKFFSNLLGINKDGEMNTNKRQRRNAMINSINDLKYRYKMKNKFDKELNEAMEQKNTSQDQLAEKYWKKDKGEKSNDDLNIGTCKEIGSSSESIILEDNKMISPQREAKFEKQVSERHVQEVETTQRSPEDNQKESKEDGTKSHDIFAVIKDKIKNVMGYFQRIFEWNSE